ncbi:ABC transporter permease [Anaerosporobacter faecicola]|uniref:ABC transporter permease n=1 Tax=Anaerosporobacter faecicola TaxID=2718714 RepID=UPI0014390581|nr:ABC transporter permease [Anaerosporobacter faecicola]
MGIYLVIKNNIVRATKKKGNLILMLLIPIVISILTIVSLQIKNNTVRIGILESRTASMNEEQIKIMKEIFEPYDHVEVHLAQREYEKTYQIMGKYHFYIDLDKPMQAQIDQILREVGNLETVGNTVEKAIDKNAIQETTKEEQAMQQAVGLLITTFLVLATVHGAGYINDKKGGMVDRYQIAGNGKDSYYVGYCAYTFLVTAFQCGICLGLMQIFIPNFTISIWLSLKLLGAIALLSSGLSMLLVRMCKSEMQANLLSSGLAIVLSLLAGTFVETESMPQLLQNLQVINPVHWILQMLGT